MATLQDWTEEELRAAVDAYMAMLADEAAGREVNKTSWRNGLRTGALSQRSDGAVEYRMQNISHVLERMGRDRIAGYPPAANVGNAVAEKIEQIIDELAPPLRVGDIASTLDQVMGVKAVFGPMSSYLLCFGGRGTPQNERQYYSVPAGVADRALKRPYVIAIGGGSRVREGYKGRVLNLVRVGNVFGPTRRLAADATEAERLAQWPVAIVCRDVWQFVGNPHLIEDLGMQDRRILEGAQDGIIRPLEKLEPLWFALRDWPIKSVALPPAANFYDSGTPTRVGTTLPTIPGGSKSEEGKRIWDLQYRAERDPRLSRDAKRLNQAKFGVPTCEACNFQNDDSAMFDAHHPTPLAAGSRTTHAEHLQILCPTCHRRAHRGPDRLQPFSLHELCDWVRAGRR
jgi:hypothetical protein